jgi:hypothetical protein
VEGMGDTLNDKEGDKQEDIQRLKGNQIEKYLAYHLNYSPG